MAVRAHRVNKIDYQTSESFNLWHDEKLNSFFEEHGLYENMSEGTGMGNLPVEIIEEAIKKAKKLEIDKSTIRQLKSDIKWAKDNDVEYIRYYCF